MPQLLIVAPAAGQPNGRSGYCSSFAILAPVLALLTLLAAPLRADEWRDGLDRFAREVHLPAERYKWDWSQATLLRAIVRLDEALPGPTGAPYRAYLRTAMDHTLPVANGLHPNAVASGHGLAYLARATGEERYLTAAMRIHADYLTTPRTRAGGISHRTETVELWDDTVYMVGLFLLEMYRTTGDAAFLREFREQYAVHKAALADPATGLWVHGYDDDHEDYPDRCCQFGWARATPERRSREYWGRGNGWIVMAIADALRTVPAGSEDHAYFARELVEITRNLPRWQDQASGLWFQLTARPEDPRNFLESSCTAMFGYGIAVGLKQRILDPATFRPVLERANTALRTRGTRVDGNHRIPVLVCEGTCIGDAEYYFARKYQEGPSFAIGAYLLFALAWEELEPGPSPAARSEGWFDFNKNGHQDVFEDPTQPVEARIEDLLTQMTLDEKTAQLATLYGYGRVLEDPLPTTAWKTRAWKDGIANIDEMHNGVGRHDASTNPHLATPATSVAALNAVQRWFVEETRLGIPVEFTNEGIRGACYPRSTNFPAMIGLGATWDTALVGRVFDTVARESLALGYRNVYAPIVDLARDPRWGRTVECFGEDPHLVAEMSLATTRALQARGAVSTAKHFAVYSEPKGGRDGNCRTDPHVAPREMEMLHLRPWERLVREGGLLGVMSSYNDYDGVPVSGSREFLVDRLRTQWGFRGYIVSDSQAVEYLFSKHRVTATPGEAAAMFIREGGNVRTTFETPESFLEPLRAELAAGRLDPAVIDARVRDVLRVKFLQGLFERPYTPEPPADALRSDAARALALDAARASIVLLKNSPATLPFDPAKLRRLLVCGPTAALTETSYDRYGSSAGPVVSVLDGLRARLAPATEIVHTPGCAITDPRWPESELYPEPPDAAEAAALAEAVRLAATADAVVLCLGDSNKTIGESLSRTSLDLPGRQNDLARALVATGKPVIVVLLSGRPVTINWIDRHAPAVLQAWFPGEAGGTAVAEALCGDYNPGGRLPVTFPRSVGQLPFNFPAKPASQAPQGRTFDPNGFGSSMAEGVLYPFGHGLSYTTFAYSDLRLAPAGDSQLSNFKSQLSDPNSGITIPPDGAVTLSATIANTGTRAGDEVVQLYFRDDVSSVTTYELNLGGFARVHLAPGEKRTVTFTLPAAALELIDRSGQRVVEPGTFTVHLGASSTDLRLKGSFSVLPAER